MELTFLRGRELPVATTLAAEASGVSGGMFSGISMSPIDAMQSDIVLAPTPFIPFL